MAIQEFETKEELDDAFERTMERMQDEADQLKEENRLAAAEPILYVAWQFTTECPKCECTVDLADEDDGTLAVPIFNNKWDEVKGMDVECPECGYEFKIDDVQPG
jgi:hypothetical protein